MDRSTPFTVRTVPVPFGAAEIEGLDLHDAEVTEARSLLGHAGPPRARLRPSRTAAR